MLKRFCSRAMLGLTVVVATVAADVSAAHAITNRVSGNWAGYIIRLEEVTRVSAHWVVPQADCSDPAPRYTNAVFWIGIGGVPRADRPTTLTQEGFDAECIDGVVEYKAWYELETGDTGDVDLPPAQYPVRPGDRMTASITYQGGRTFTFVMKNFGDAAGMNQPWAQDFDEEHSYPEGIVPAIDSAEAIVERPVFVGQLPPLTKFDTFRFRRFRVNRIGASSPNFDDTTQRRTLLQNTAQPIGGDNTLASPGMFLNDNGRFDITWHNYGRRREP